MLASELIKGVEDGFCRRHHISGREEGDAEDGATHEELREGDENAEAVPLREKTASEASFISQAEDGEVELARVAGADCNAHDRADDNGVRDGSPSASTPVRTCCTAGAASRAYLEGGSSKGIGGATTPMASDEELAKLRERLRPRHHAAYSTR